MEEASPFTLKRDRKGVTEDISLLLNILTILLPMECAVDPIDVGIFVAWDLLSTKLDTN